MNKENVDFLKDRLFFLGFGDKMNAELEKKIEQQPEKFTMSMQGEFSKGEQKNIVDYSLDFSRSKQNDMYFLNNYTATLKNDDPEKERSQKFYLNNGSGITAKEAYNLLDGRAVHKTNLTNKNNEKYEAWLQLNLNEKDDKGNHKVQQYHKAWNYDLDRNLGRHPIKELENATQKEQLVKSMEKGNIQQVTFINEDKKEVKMFLEANPKERNVIVYDENMKKQFQGIRKAKPAINEGKTNQNEPDTSRMTVQEQSQGFGARGADSNGKNQSASTAEGKDKKGETMQNDTQEKKTIDKSKVEKRGFETDSPVRTRPKKRGMSV